MLGMSWLTDPAKLRIYGLPFAVALIVTLVATPIVRRVAIKLDLYDRPDSGLKPHERPIPYLGGIAIYVGWLAALAWMLPVASGRHAHLGWVALCGTILMLTGLIDDIRHLPPRTRLFVQVLVAFLLVYGGVGATVVPSLLDHYPMPLWLYHGPVCQIACWAFCAFVLAGASNSTNLIDGLDGLCAGVMAIASLGALAISVRISMTTVSADEMGALRTALCLGLFGACLAFLFYNFNPASIFMGDSGSLLLGFNMALLLILLAQQPDWKWLAAGIMVFGFPIFDTALAITRRKINGRPLFVGDRSHFYDQLRDRGWSVRRTVLICYAIGIALAVLGVFLVTLPSGYAITVCVLLPLLAMLACWRAGMLRVDDAAKRSDD